MPDRVRKEIQHRDRTVDMIVELQRSMAMCTAPLNQVGQVHGRPVLVVWRGVVRCGAVWCTVV